MTLSKNSLTDFEVVVPEGIAAIRIDKESGNVSKSFNNSYFEYFLRILTICSSNQIIQS